MNEEIDTFNALRGTVIDSAHGGYYLFVPDYGVGSLQTPNDDVWGHITAYGNIKNIIENKIIHDQLITDWLGSWKQEKMIARYKQICDIYATHILYTWPDPGGYWKWKE